MHEVFGKVAMHGRTMSLCSNPFEEYGKLVAKVRGLLSFFHLHFEHCYIFYLPSQCNPDIEFLVDYQGKEENDYHSLLKILLGG